MTWTSAAPAATVSSHPDGDSTDIEVRLLVAPVDGRFRPSATDGSPEGEVIHVGTVIGHVLHAGEQQPVRSFCPGVLVQVIAASDEQVRTGEPLAWLRPVAS